MAEKTLTITQGDITLLPLSDGAIVNPSNTGMILNRGVSSQIVRRAGPFIQQTLHMRRSGLHKNRLEPGEAIETEAGQLPVKTLIHVSILGAKKIDERLISNCILNAYDLVEDLELTAVAFPAVGVESANFPMEKFLDLFFRITNEEVPHSETIRDVLLCLDDQQHFEMTQDYLEENFDMLDERIEVNIEPGGIVPGML
jgi:O-acetyl-ADP-ribose deacetylase (regulator of RNase III)